MKSEAGSRDEKLEALLSGPRLSGPRRDRVLAGVLAGTVQRRPQRWGWWVGAATFAVAAAIILLMVWPNDGFRSRGSAKALLEIGCVDGTLGACPAGSALLFRVSGAGDGGFLAAWAEPVGGGERVWYFPTSATASPKVLPSVELQTLPSGVRIGPEHAAGVWTVHLLLTAKAYSHEELLALPAGERMAEANIALVVR